MTKTELPELLSLLLRQRDFVELSEALASELRKLGCEQLENNDDVIWQGRELPNVAFRKLYRLWTIPSWNSLQKSKDGSVSKYDENQKLSAFIKAEHQRKLVEHKKQLQAQQAELDKYNGIIMAHFKKLGLPEIVIEKTIIKKLTLDTAKAMAGALNK